MAFFRCLQILILTAVFAYTATAASTIVVDKYLVMLKPHVTSQQLKKHQQWAQHMHSLHILERRGHHLPSDATHYTYDFGHVKGYSMHTSAETIARIHSSSDVAYIEPDQIWTVNSIVEQRSAPSWGLERVSQSQKTYSTSYYYDDSAGKNITVYVVDTGIMANHTEFEGRARFGYSSVANQTDDGNGHGTHVSGIIAGKTVGVAKKASLIAVKVVSDSGSGPTSSIIAGVNYVVNDAQSKGRTQTSVVNMSLRASKSAAADAAVQAATDAGIIVVVAAGNSYDNASHYSPSRMKSPVVVGALDKNNEMTEYSSWGPTVDIIAPGDNIVSAWIDSITSTKELSGTSMACPHVTGAAAYLMALEGLQGTDAVLARLLQLSGQTITAGDEWDRADTTNATLYNGSGH